MKDIILLVGLSMVITSVATTTAGAAECPAGREALTEALKASVKPAGGPANGGLENNEWAALVDRNGQICEVTFSGKSVHDQWLGSRAIGAEKAATANAVSLDGFALSTANLYAGAQPKGPLYGILTTNPAATEVLYSGDPANYGSAPDPMIRHTLGGVVVFGGGLALYDDSGMIGALGDTSCADRNVAWRVRDKLGLAAEPNSVSPSGNDANIYDFLPNQTSQSGYGHVMCGGKEPEIAQQIGAGVVPKWAQ